MTSMLTAVVLGLSVATSVPQVVSKPSIRENPETTLREALRLIEVKDYRTFLLEYMPPDMVKAKAASEVLLNEWIEYFATHGVVYTLPKMREAIGVEPKFDATKTTATFPLKDYDGTKWYKLIKVGRYWYVDPWQ